MMKQDPPWKVGLPFALGVIITGTTWFFSRQPIALLAAVVLAAWGAFWVYGARRSLRNTAREAGTPALTTPGPGQALVLSRARRGLSPRRGYLILTAEQLLWWNGTPGRPLNPAHSIAVSELIAWGGQPRALASLWEIDGFRHEPGFIGGDTLTLRTVRGASIRLTLYDPEGFVLILELIEKSHPT